MAFQIFSKLINLALDVMTDLTKYLLYLNHFSTFSGIIKHNDNVFIYLFICCPMFAFQQLFLTHCWIV